MTLISIREFSISTTLSLFLGLLCLGFLSVANANPNKYDLSLFRTYFGCPECDVSQCKNPVGCELIKEPGLCGCCMTCARAEGESCGISTEQCSFGLRCNPPENAIDGFEALMEGNGICEAVEVPIFPGFSMVRRASWQKPRRSGLPFPPRNF